MKPVIIARVQCSYSYPFLCLWQVGRHDRLGMQLIPLKLLTPNETKELTLDLVKNSNVNDPQNKKRRGKIVVELTFIPFKPDSIKFDENCDGNQKKESGTSRSSDDETLGEAGLLSVMIQEAEDVEGEHHNNPYALIHFRGEKKKTKVTFKIRMLYSRFNFHSIPCL